MSARVVPNSVSIVAQTAPPTSVSVYPGRNRRFFLMRFGQGTSSGVTDPTLGGQAHDQKDFRAGFGNNIGTYWWDESTLQTAGVGVNAAGALAVAGFVESGITEYIWCWGTVKNTLQSIAPQSLATVNTANEDTFTFPSTVAAILSDNSQDYILLPQLYLTLTTDPAIEDITDAALVKGPVAQTSYVAYLHETIAADLVQWTTTLDVAKDEALGVGIVLREADMAVSGPELPIHAVQTRSMDAKTIADRYNLGVAKQEDYIFNDRKFYQDGTTS